LNYFIRNPQAADTLEGIARWRLLEETVHRKVSETSAALEWLAERGYLHKRVSSSVDPIFSLNQNKIREARKFLATAEVSRSPGRKK
jgi:hypothetical protein